jgi:hypothetical protein
MFLIFFRIRLRTGWGIVKDVIRETGENFLNCLKKELGKGQVIIIIFTFIFYTLKINDYNYNNIFLVTIDEEIHDVYTEVRNGGRGRRQ